MKNQRQEGNPLAQEITFGVEIECFVPNGVLPRGQYHRGVDLMGHGFPIGWTAENDMSLSTTKPGYEAIEIVSPILKGIEGLEQVKKVAARLTELKAHVNKTCGFHVHIGAHSAAGPDFDNVADWVRRMINTTAHFEEAIYGAGGSKRRRTGTYAKSLKDRWGQVTCRNMLTKKIKANALQSQLGGMDKYYALNVYSLFTSKRTVEFRSFSGTVEAKKMVSWIQMSLAIANLAQRHNTRFDAPKTKYADTDTAAGSMKRFFYLAGWLKGKKNVHKHTCIVEGWIDDLAELKATRKELMRLAKKYDAQS